MWRGGTLSIRMSVFVGKQGLIELRGADSTKMADAPRIEQCFRISKFKRNLFCYKGFLDWKTCLFKIDTGSDVSVTSEKVIKGPKRRFKVKNCFLKYPTGETIPVKYRVNVEIELGKYLLEIPMLVADISDECILGTDFLEKVGLDRVFEFGKTEKRNKTEFSCSRILEEKVPHFLQIFFEENSKNLYSFQKEIFADFLVEFQDVFSENLIAGNCEIWEHSINVKDSKPIKQTPRRIPLHLREEVEHIIQEMKQRELIEESRSPWTSPVVLVKKKDGSLRFCVDYRKCSYS